MSTEVGFANRNIEIKARLRAPQATRLKARALSRSEGQLLRQEDFFFRVPAGRLKLRVFTPRHGELIFYRRPDESGARVSSYNISVTSEPGRLLELLSLALGLRGVVRKAREVYIVGQTRIHLDSVEGLGAFVELEFVMHPDDEENSGRQVVAELMDTLGILPSDLVDSAYVDLLGL